MVKQVFRVLDMHCTNCAMTIEGLEDDLPGVKSVAEQGFPGFDADTWGGLVAPLGTPQV